MHLYSDNQQLRQKFNFFKKPLKFKEKTTAVSCLERFIWLTQTFLINPLFLLAFFVLLDPASVTSINNYMSVNSLMLQDFGITILGIAIKAEIIWLSLRVLYLPKNKIKNAVIRSSCLMLTNIFTYFSFAFMWTEILNFLTLRF